ncbi:PKD domain-containing protein [uncultured Thiothrix sp.]|uniref:PKD domain-containing protein n=1 Tax=uncultured Thiothrix sp. TaxID=223185 RepID=UPI00260611A4|nr:PKD domain-containing protein [uncultured Thiothrix sp.]
MKITRLLQSLCLSVGVATVLAACGGGSDSSNSGSTNHQPTADAGANQTVLVNAEVSLDGSNSKDPDGDALTYAWRIISKPATSNSSLSNSTTIKPKILVDKVGDYVLGLIVKDGSLTSVTDTMIIKVTANTATNHAPIAQAGADRTASLGQVITLDGSASSDADNDALSYQWTLTTKPTNSAATLTTTTVAKTNLTLDKAGKYIASLIVNDGTLNSAVDTVVLTVPSSNEAPSVNLGADRNAAVTTLGTSAVSLPATILDPNGDTLSYQWAILSKPTTSALTNIQVDAQGNGSFIPDVLGSYELKLTASDGSLSGADSIILNVIKANTGAPIARSTDKYLLLGKTIVLDASTSSDPDNDTLTYKWVLKSAPSASTASLSSLTAVKPNFTPDKLGDYLFELTVSDGSLTSEAISVKVSAQPAINGLNYQVIDAEYSKALDKVIMLSSSPNQLHIYDAATNTEQAISLPLVPTSVSVGLDGLYAAVGHDANISYVDLKNAKLLKTLPVAAKVLDIVLAGNGYAYAFPKEDQWQDIYSVNLNTGEVTGGSGYTIYAGTLAKLHPNGTSMYGANNGLSPDDIEKYDIQTGKASKLYDSPYHGDYPMCGNLWFSEEGKRIFTACGNVFRAADLKVQDMLYNGSLAELTHIQDLAHSATAAKVAAIPKYVQYANLSESVDNQVLTYDYEYLTPSDTFHLPYFVVNDKGFMGHGKFVFFNKVADSLIVILKADASSAMLNDYGVYNFKR